MGSGLVTSHLHNGQDGLCEFPRCLLWDVVPNPVESAPLEGTTKFAIQQNDHLPGWIPDIGVPDFQEIGSNVLEFEHGISSRVAGCPSTALRRLDGGDINLFHLHLQR
jgi:hypothetical protein